MPKHILTVDDEVNIRRLVEINLQHAGYRVSCAADGQEALEKIAADRPDLVLLDVIMPRLDGFEVLRRLKSDSATVEIPVVMLTVKAMNADVFEGWQGGVHYYLTKPFSPQELLLVVKRALLGLPQEEEGSTAG
jgi:DNA-binding response OmpR family regulator